MAVPRYVDKAVEGEVLGSLLLVAVVVGIDSVATRRSSVSTVRTNMTVSTHLQKTGLWKAVSCVDQKRLTQSGLLRMSVLKLHSVTECT